MDLLDRLLGHDRWTTGRLMTMARGLSDVQLDRDFDIGHRTLRQTFAHMIRAMELWTGLMAGTPNDREDMPTSVDDLLARHARAYDRFEGVARELVARNRLDETFTDHHDFPQSYGSTIFQVVMHNQQHRGELLHMLQRLGVPDLPDGDPQEWEHTTGHIAATRGMFAADGAEG